MVDAIVLHERDIADKREMGRQVNELAKRASYLERLATAALITLQAHSEEAYDLLLERAKEWE